MSHTSSQQLLRSRVTIESSNPYNLTNLHVGFKNSDLMCFGTLFFHMMQDLCGNLQMDIFHAIGLMEVREHAPAVGLCSAGMHT